MSWKPASLLLTCLALIASSASGLAQTHEFKDKNQTLEIDFPFGHRPQYGFQTVRITATNPERSKAVWEISIEEDGYFRGRPRANFGQHDSRLEVPPGATVQRDILLALGNNEMDHYGGSWNILTVDVTMPSGIRDSWNNRSSFDSHGSHNYYINVPMIVGPGVKPLVSSHGRTDTSGIMNTSTAPSDWRAYTPYSMVMLTSNDWASMRPDARLALSDWIRLGGTLQYVDEIPADGIKPDIDGSNAYGLGEIHGPPSGNKDDIKSYETVKEFEREGITSLLASVRDNNMLRTWLRTHAPKLLLENFTIWPVVLVLIAFFVMITPVNLFVLAPSRRRYRLIKTIPIISLAACVALAIAVFLGDGTGGEGQRITLIEIQPGSENRHYINQWQASQCGAIIGSSFQIDEQAYIAPINELGSESSLRIDADRIEGSGGWFASRSSQSHRLKAVRPSRGRIEWKHPAEKSPSAVSTFDFPIQDIYVHDEDGNWWHTSSVNQGSKQNFESIEPNRALKEIHDLTHQLPHGQKLLQSAKTGGRFFAFTNSPPAIETLGAIDWDDFGIITGPLVGN